MTGARNVRAGIVVAAAVGVLALIAAWLTVLDPGRTEQAGRPAGPSAGAGLPATPGS
jgi:hypothetical protein